MGYTVGGVVGLGVGVVGAEPFGVVPLVEALLPRVAHVRGIGQGVADPLVVAAPEAGLVGLAAADVGGTEVVVVTVPGVIAGVSSDFFWSLALTAKIMTSTTNPPPSIPTIHKMIVTTVPSPPPELEELLSVGFAIVPVSVLAQVVPSTS